MDAAMQQPEKTRSARVLRSRASNQSTVTRAPKEPVLQLFVRPMGVPEQRGLWVAVFSSDGRVAFTQSSDRCEPLFSHPLELWGQASGKEASMPLTFKVMAKAQTLAEAHIESGELRKFGLYNPREGAAVALPLKMPDEMEAAGQPPLARDAALHCYVHAGYSVRRRHGQVAALPREQAPLGDAADSGGHCGDCGGDGGDGSLAGGCSFGAAPQWSSALPIEYASVRPADPLVGLLHLHMRIWNANRRRVASPHWQCVDNSGKTDVRSTILPPCGRFENVLVLHQEDAHGGETRPEQLGGECEGVAVSHAQTAVSTPLAGATVSCVRAMPRATIGDDLDATVAEHEADTLPWHDDVLLHIATGLSVDFTTLGMASAIGDQRAPSATAQDNLLNVRMRLPSLTTQLPLPVVVKAPTLFPIEPCVGEAASLEIHLAWPPWQTYRRLAPQVRGEHAFIEIEFVPSADWIVLGAQRQRLVLRTNAVGDAYGATRAAKKVSSEWGRSAVGWRVVPLVAGQVILPELHVLLFVQVNGVLRSQPLPPIACGVSLVREAQAGHRT